MATTESAMFSSEPPETGLLAAYVPLDVRVIEELDGYLLQRTGTDWNGQPMAPELTATALISHGDMAICIRNNLSPIEWLYMPIEECRFYRKADRVGRRIKTLPPIDTYRMIDLK